MHLAIAVIVVGRDGNRSYDYRPTDDESRGAILNPAIETRAVGAGVGDEVGLTRYVDVRHTFFVL